MSLAERLAAPAATVRTTCGIVKLTRGLDAADRAAVHAALGDEGWNSSALARALGVGVTVVGRHRRGDCSCERP